MKATPVLPSARGPARPARASRPRFGAAGPALMLALAILTAEGAAQSAAAKTIFVTPAGSGPGYAADGTMAAELTQPYSSATMRSALPGDVVQLLADDPKPDAVTLYRERVALSQKGAPDALPITVRGLGAKTRMVGKSVDRVRDCPMPDDHGERSCGDLYAVLAAPRKSDLFAALLGSASPPADGGARTAGAHLAIPIGRIGRLAEAACLDLDRVDGLVVEDLTFEDCWLAAVRAIGSRRIVLRRSLIIGSSYGLAARGRADHPSDTLTVENVTWVQDASGFDPASLTREGPFRCRDGRTTELGCPGLMWRSIPWGVSHHGTYEHFNGALLGGSDVQGPVIFRRNRVLAAYNGIRLKASGCEDLPASGLSPTSCPFNANLWIFDNLFSYVRDNPVELETWATNAHIFHNRIHNAHAWFSFDDMGGGPVYVYGNRGWFDDMPSLAWTPSAPGGPPCSRRPLPATGAGFDPALDRRFDYLKVRWLPVGVEAIDAAGRVDWMDPAEQSCAASILGRVIKLALPEKGAAPGTFRYAARAPIYVFNNSWFLRAPVTGIGAAANLRHWNNAVLFCEPGVPGYDASLCKVRPETFATDCGREFVRSDDLGRYAGTRGSVPFFDCFRWLPMDERGEDLPSLASVFDHDVSSNGFPQGNGLPATFERHGRMGDPGFRTPARGDFTLVPGALAATSACLVGETGEGGLACADASGERAFAGAVGPDGKPYAAPASPRFRPPD
ncbi:hypothetical protein [Methylobacterium planeticum]|uniref:Uncharacterized protein n=1 Tax=Methylobacterium planeticum TaxID=2615211 RepID=A0A6N6MM21_9HYPH|nr:hypothetical protein [Methylobacterium planeticum]KAB1072336.1 hypothetical protein F6X51_16685 [Methylobacterium planeticum]